MKFITILKGYSRPWHLFWSRCGADKGSKIFWKRCEAKLLFYWP